MVRAFWCDLTKLSQGVVTEHTWLSFQGWLFASSFLFVWLSRPPSRVLAEVCSYSNPRSHHRTHSPRHYGDLWSLLLPWWKLSGFLPLTVKVMIKLKVAKIWILQLTFAYESDSSWQLINFWLSVRTMILLLSEWEVDRGSFFLPADSSLTSLILLTFPSSLSQIFPLKITHKVHKKSQCCFLSIRTHLHWSWVLTPP